MTEQQHREVEEIDADIGKFGMWVNDNIVGNPVTFILCILAVIIVYAMIPVVGGYNKWNTGLGLFFNTLSSSFELITGVGAVVGVVVLHKAGKAREARHHAQFLKLHAKHDAEIAKRDAEFAALHAKLDALTTPRGAPLAES